MGCTTILVGKNASYDGSTIMARTDDAEDGSFDPVRVEILDPSKTPTTYKSVISHCSVELPAEGMRCTYVPHVDKTSQGIWGEAGINEAGVAMTATETITTNATVLGADPLVEYVAPQGSEKEHPGGIGEEDFVTLVLPYIKTAREGVLRTGKLLEEYGTYETNGIGFADGDEIWWIETIGGHHWIARRVPDDTYCLIANQLSLDCFDIEDAFSLKKNYLCSSDLLEWMKENHLEPVVGSEDEQPNTFNPRKTFGSDTWRDRVYNTPRVWYGMSLLNPSNDYFSQEPEFSAQSPDLPWCRVPQARIRIEDVRTVLSAHYQNTAFDPYGSQGDSQTRRLYRPIGINRTSFCALLQVRKDVCDAAKSIMWVAMASMPFSTFVPLFTDVDKVPAYLETPADIDTHTFYWQVRMLAGLADPEYYLNVDAINAFSQKTIAAGLRHIAQIDAKCAGDTQKSREALEKTLEEANEEICQQANADMQVLLDKALYNRSMHMLNRFDMSDH